MANRPLSIISVVLFFGGLFLVASLVLFGISQFIFSQLLQLYPGPYSVVQLRLAWSLISVWTLVLMQGLIALGIWKGARLFWFVGTGQSIAVAMVAVLVFAAIFSPSRSLIVIRQAVDFFHLSLTDAIGGVLSSILLVITCFTRSARVFCGVGRSLKLGEYLLLVLLSLAFVSFFFVIINQLLFLNAHFGKGPRP